MKKRAPFIHPQSFYENRKQAQSEVYLVKKMAERRKRDKPSKLYLEKTKVQAEQKSQNSDEILGQIRDLLRSIDGKIPRFDNNDSATLGAANNGMSSEETMRLLGLGAHQHKGMANGTQIDKSHEQNSSISDKIAVVKNEMISLRKKIDLHKIKYLTKQDIIFQSSSTAVPTTTEVPPDVLKLNKYILLNQVLDNLYEQVNRDSNHGHPARGENVVELLEKVIDYEGHELNSTLNASEEHFNLYQSGFVVLVSAVVVLMVLFILLCFFYNCEINRNPQKGKGDPIFKVTPRRRIKKMFGKIVLFKEITNHCLLFK